jgi:hypothetical protein
MSSSCWYFIEKIVVTYRKGIARSEDFNGRLFKIFKISFIK